MGAYAIVAAEKSGAFEVKTPGQGFSLIKGLSEQDAHNIARVINRAYENGMNDVRYDIKVVLGITACTCEGTSHE